MRVFIGFDPRQPAAFTVLAHSIWKRASKPVDIVRLQYNQLPVKRTGLTQFTYTRYAVPYLCGYEGEALFMDADMLCLSDIHELKDSAPEGGVCVVKNKQRFEWPSLMYFRNAQCTALTLDLIEQGTPQSMNWATVGELPSQWNHLVFYDQPRADAKVVHFTAGIPCWQETRHSEYAKEWMHDASECLSTVSWEELMGNSVHRKAVGL